MSVRNSSKFHGSVLSGKQLKTLLALHALLLVHIVGGEPRWVGGEGGVLILVMEFKGVDTLALLVEEVSQDLESS